MEVVQIASQMRDHLNQEHWKGKYCELHPTVKVYVIDEREICGECDIMKSKAEARGEMRINCEKIDRINAEDKAKKESKKPVEDYKSKAYKD